MYLLCELNLILIAFDNVRKAKSEGCKLVCELHREGAMETLAVKQQISMLDGKKLKKVLSHEQAYLLDSTWSN